MMKCFVLALFAVLALSYLEKAEARKFAICNCSGCRPQKIYCDYNTFGGCNCPKCACFRSSRPPTHTCCASCKSGWGGKKYRCWQCPVGRGCNYRGCGCY